MSIFQHNLTCNLFSHINLHQSSKIAQVELPTACPNYSANFCFGLNLGWKQGARIAQRDIATRKSAGGTYWLRLDSRLKVVVML